MARLTTKQRNALPRSAFALPATKKGEKDKYPVNDREHAGLAKGFAQKQYDKGKMSKATLNKIDAKANKVLKKTSPKSKVNSESSAKSKPKTGATTMHNVTTRHIDVLKRRQAKLSEDIKKASKAHTRYMRDMEKTSAKSKAKPKARAAKKRTTKKSY